MSIKKVQMSYENAQTTLNSRIKTKSGNVSVLRLLYYTCVIVVSGL